MKTTKTLTIKENCLDEVLTYWFSTYTSENLMLDDAVRRCKEAIIADSMDVDAEIQAQVRDVVESVKDNWQQTADRRLEEAVAREKEGLIRTFDARLKTARRQGHEAGCKDAVLLRQQLDDAHRAKARAQSELETKQDPFGGSHPDVFVIETLNKLFTAEEMSVDRRKEGVMQSLGDRSVFYTVRQRSFQTAWLKEIKLKMQASLATAAVIISVAEPGPRQSKEVKDAMQSGIYVCRPSDLRTVASIVCDRVQREEKQALVKSAKQDSAGALYDWVTGGEMQVMQSIFLDSLKEEDRAINGLENQLAKLRSAREKKLENFNSMIAKMQSHTKLIEDNS